MTTKIFELVVSANPERVWEFHSSAEALNVLTPPDRQMRLVSTDLTVRDGAIHEFRVKIGLFWSTWIAELSDVRPPAGFRDTARKAPFKNWTHHHQFLEHPNGTLIRDTVSYELPFGIVGRIADRLFISQDIDRLFAFRQQATACLLDGKAEATQDLRARTAVSQG